MTIPDSPALDLDALTALEQAATPAPWEAHMVQPNMAGNHQWYLHPVPRRPAGVHATGRGEDIDLIVAMRNQLPALLSALTAARAEQSAWTAPTRCAQQDCELPASLCHLHESDRVAALERELATVTQQRDHYLRSFKAQQAENDRVHAKVREQYDVIEHAKKKRNEAREQAKQAQAELAALQVQYAGVQMERDLAHEQLRGWRQRATGQRANAAAALATCSCQWSPVQGRIWCDSCAAARDAVVEAAAAPQADDLPGMWEQADLTGGQTDAEPVPAGGEDGSGTAGGEVPA